MTARARIGWVKFKEYRELLNSKRFSLKMKGMVYWSCVRLAMLCGSEIWCLRENEVAILRRTERAMVRTMESGYWRDCCQSRVNPAIPIYEDKPGTKLD